MRLPAALVLAVPASACAGDAPGPPSVPIGTTIVARVVASREMAFVSARSSMDVTFAEGFAHRIAPRDSPGTSFVALATSADCPASGDPARLYELSFVRRRIAFGITSAEDEQWTTDLEIVSCRPVGGGE
jgi:hypothetical protein